MKKTGIQDNPSKILVVSAVGMGNTILAIPALRKLRKHFKQAHITLLVFLNAAKELFETCPYVDEVQYISYKTKNPVVPARTLLRLRKRNFDVSIITFPAPRIHYNLLSYLSGAPVRIAHTYRDKNISTLNFLNTVRIEMEELHDIDQNLNLLAPLGISIADANRDLELWLTPGEKKRAGQLLDQRGVSQTDFLVGIHPGCSENQPWKRWPYRYFANLADKLMANYPLKILLFIGPQELEAEEEITSSMKNEPIVVKELPIRHVSALVGECSLFISNDSGLMHVAEAMNVPTFGIFGPSDYIRMAPYRDLNWVIRLDFECSRECAHALSKLAHGFHCIHGENICLTKLTPDQVFPRMKEFLASTDLKTRSVHTQKKVK